MKKIISTILFAVLFALLLGGSYFWVEKSGRFFENKGEVVTTPNPNADKWLAELEGAEAEESVVTQVTKALRPALISVNVQAVEKVIDFWGFAYEQEVVSNASGIIVAQNADELLIVTNYHVVDGANKVTVSFVDGCEVVASVKATEEEEDLAVISVGMSVIPETTKETIRIAILGDSDSLKPGMMVIAIGNALGHGQSTTVGYVSALDRELVLDNRTMKLIQTDAAINPGNSGGALINQYGEVVGINNAKISSSAVEGMCYAIPISRAIPIIESLMNREAIAKSEQAYLGISGKIISEEYSQAFNMPRGIYVVEVVEGSAAENAGVHSGDVITKINGHTVYSEEAYEKVLSYTRGGTDGTVVVSRLRNGKYVEEELNIVFGIKGQ